MLLHRSRKKQLHSLEFASAKSNAPQPSHDAATSYTCHLHATIHAQRTTHAQTRTHTAAHALQSPLKILLMAHWPTCMRNKGTCANAYISKRPRTKPGTKNFETASSQSRLTERSTHYCGGPWGPKLQVGAGTLHPCPHAPATSGAAHRTATPHAHGNNTKVAS